MVRVISVTGVSSYLSPSEMGDGISYYRDEDYQPSPQVAKEETHQRIAIQKRHRTNVKVCPIDVGKEV